MLSRDEQVDRVRFVTALSRAAMAKRSGLSHEEYCHLQRAAMLKREIDKNDRKEMEERRWSL